jgi:putative methyltransferase (TIGR01177 family)
MSYIYRLAGENIGLACSEAESLLGQELDRLKDSERLFRSQGLLENPERLALMHEVSRQICQLEDLEETKFRPEGSFKVSIRSSVTGTEVDEEYIGRVLKTEKNDVDLESPEETINVYSTGSEAVVSKQVCSPERGLYRKRSNEKRPFSSPISLDPVQARTLVNLSGAEPGQKVLDPFCGTGGVLIEAGLCGMAVKGTDVQQKMVEGTRENLEAFGILNHDVSCRDISDVEAGETDVIVTDPPYGKSSYTSGNPLKQFLDLVKDFDGTCVFMYNEPEVGGYKSEFEIYEHSSLTRYVFIE